jgi:hypothetical protein
MKIQRRLNSRQKETSLRKVKPEIKAQQKAKVDSLSLADNNSIMGSIDRIRKIDNPKSADLTENSRINEQDLFAAITENSLGQISTELSSKFNLAFAKEVETFKVLEEPNSMLKATRKALNSLIKDNQLSRYAAKQIRKFAVGKAQLDDNRSRLSVAKENPESSETPLRAVKTALQKISENAIASDAEFHEYRQQGRKVA